MGIHSWLFTTLIDSYASQGLNELGSRLYLYFHIYLKIYGEVQWQRVWQW